MYFSAKNSKTDSDTNEIDKQRARELEKIYLYNYLQYRVVW